MQTSNPVRAALVSAVLAAFALPMPADGDVVRKRFGRRFPVGWCPMQNDRDGTGLGVHVFRTPSNNRPVTISFVAESWLVDDEENPVGAAIDDIRVFKAYTDYDEDLTVYGEECNGQNEEVTPSYVFTLPAAMQDHEVFFDNFENPAGPHPLWTGLLTADGTPSSCSTADCSDADLPTYWLKTTSANGGSNSLGFGRQADIGDPEARFAGTSITLNHLEPDTDYVVVGWWHFANQDFANSSVSIEVKAGATVLLVDDDDDAPEVLPEYERLMSSLGRLRLRYITAPDPGVYSEPLFLDPPLQCAVGDICLNDYDTVIWFTGDKYEEAGEMRGPAGPSNAETEEDLDSFLELGGCLAIVSQDYMRDRPHPGDCSSGGSCDGSDVLSPFMIDTLGVDCGNSDQGQATVFGEGSLFAAFPGPYPLDETLFPGFERRPDLLVPRAAIAPQISEVAFEGNVFADCTVPRGQLSLETAVRTSDVGVLANPGGAPGSTPVEQNTLYLGYPLELIADDQGNSDYRAQRELLAAFLGRCDPTCHGPYHIDFTDPSVSADRTVYACNSIGLAEPLTVGAGVVLELLTSNAVIFEHGFSFEGDGQIRAGRPGD